MLICCSWCVCKLLLSWFYAAAQLGVTYLLFFVQPSWQLTMFSNSSFTVTVNFATLAAVFMAQLVRAIWFNERMPWRGSANSFFFTGVACDAGLTVLLQSIVRSCYSVHDIQDAAFLCMWITLLYVCLEAPNHVYNHSSLQSFMPRAALKFLIMLAIVCTLMLVK